ncbi:MAG: hypothetical protein AB1705_13655 [Verrucomicrobiota bacterium]
MRTETETQGRSLLPALAVLAIVLVALFSKSFQASQALFANDGPLGQNMAEYGRLPGAFAGMWNDLYWVGNWHGTAVPNLTCFLLWFLKPVGFAKYIVPVSLLLLGVTSWFFFRQLGFHGFVCLAGALAAMLNMNSFSNACWGLPTWVLAKAMVFLAMGLLLMGGRSEWLRVPLAGLAVGMCVMEGFDMGAIYSLYVAAFALFLFLDSKPMQAGGRAWGVGIAKVAVIAAFAGFIAAQTLSTLIGTQISGIAGTAQDKKTKEERYDFATQWSLPKMEALRVIIPGLYGYRMDTPNGGEYWGRVGGAPVIDRLEDDAAGFDSDKRTKAESALAGLRGNTMAFRSSGSGEYAGVLVVLLAFWAVLQSFRGASASYSPTEKRWIWFWAGVAVLSLLFAFGRHAPFYQLLYQLPYFSTIRNPIKFMQPFHMATGILFAYALQDLWRRYLAQAPAKVGSFAAAINQWWSSVAGFDRKWTVANLFLVGGSFLAWLLYVSSKKELLRHLQDTGFSLEAAQAIAAFSSVEVGLFILFLTLSVLVVTLILSGTLAGERARFAGLMVVALLVIDLGRANQPWIKYYDYQERYAANPVTDILRQQAYEHRVAVMPFQGFPQLSLLQQFYHSEWLQHQFPYNNIQSMDIAQEPRQRTENVKYRDQLKAAPVRLWELTNTRYLLGLTAFQSPQGVVNFVDLFNQQLDPVKKRFRVHTPFILKQSSGPEGPVQVETNTGGPFAIIEFTGALPRAQLYSHWRTMPDEQALLELGGAEFDATKTVLVAESIPAPATSPGAPTNPVEFASYSSKLIRLKAHAAGPAVLLLNDKHDPNWKVTVNGEPAELLRCNYLMRGVYLKQAGEYTVEFRFELPGMARKISWLAVGVALVLSGLLVARREKAPVESAAAKAPISGGSGQKRAETKKSGSGK